MGLDLGLLMPNLGCSWPCHGVSLCQSSWTFLSLLASRNQERPWAQSPGHPHPQILHGLFPCVTAASSSPPACGAVWHLATSEVSLFPVSSKYGSLLSPPMGLLSSGSQSDPVTMAEISASVPFCTDPWCLRSLR